MHDFAILTEFCPLKTADSNGDPVNDPTVFKYYLILWNTFSEIELKKTENLPHKKLNISPKLNIPLRRLKVAILKLPLPLPLLQTAIMEIHAILKAQTDAAADSSKTCHFL